MIYIGIDPGKTGAIATIFANKASVYKCPTIGKEYDIRAMAKLITAITENNFASHEIFCTIEKVHAYPGQGVNSVFSFGKGYGIWLGILHAEGVPFKMVTPQAWKKDAGLIGTDKKHSIVVAQRRFPDIKIPNTLAGTGLSDALLIADYGRRIQNGH